MGELGNGGTQGRTVPNRVQNLEDVAHIEAGLHHVLALTKDYRIFVWGSNAYGQLGNPSFKKLSTTPVQLKCFAHAQPFKIACGSYHSLCLSYGEPNVQSKGTRELDFSFDHPVIFYIIYTNIYINRKLKSRGFVVKLID